MKRFFAQFAFACFILPAIAHAHDDTPDREKPRPRKTAEEQDALRSKRYGAFELRFAPYFPAVDKEFKHSTPFKDAFGKGPAWTLGIEGDWQIFHIPHLGSLGPGVAWHYLSTKGIAPFTDPNTPGTSSQTQRFWMMPMYVAAVFRLDVLKRELHVPLVPYAKLGFSVNLWETRDGGSVSTADGIKGRGLDLGWNGQLGLMLHLNPISPQAVADMDATAGVNDTYLFAEWWYSNVNSFGHGMQVGSSTVCAGLAFEF